MKRLLPLLLLLTAFAPLAQAQSLSGTLAPTANPDTVSMSVDDESIFIDVLANDEESNPGLTLVIERINTPPENGTARVDRNRTPTDGSDDTIEYTPADGFAGVDSLLYQIENSGGATDEAWVFIFVSNPPTATDDAFTVLPNRTTRLDVLANDSDPDGDDLGIESIAVAPDDGTATISTTGSGAQFIDYSPDDDFTGRDTLRYVVDANGLTDLAWVYLVVNTPPVAGNDAVTTRPGQAVDIDVIANDTDADGDDLNVAAITAAPAQGTATILDDDTIRYTPPAGFTGTVTFSYSVADDFGTTDEATVTVAVNTPPVAEDDEAETLVDTPVTVDVLANDTDADGDALTVEAITMRPRSGTASILADGRIRYTPSAGFSGTETLTYRIEDAAGGTDTAVLTITVRSEAMVQLIHNLVGTGLVDVYLNDVRVADDLDYREATPYLMTAADGLTTVEVVDGGDATNDDPIFSGTATLEANETYVVVASGVVGENALLAVNDQARKTAGGDAQVDLFVVHGVPGAGQIDVRQLDPFQNNDVDQILADNLSFSTFSAYRTLAAGEQNIDVANFDGSTVYDVFGFDFAGESGEALVLLASGRVGDDLVLIAYDPEGNALTGDVVTDTDPTMELPGAFALDGNFPNPFNPTTTIRFDLPAAAEVSVEVVDLLGRTLMIQPAQQVAAGANRSLSLDASSLASGTYLYRVIARTAGETHVAVGRMTLIK